jgi:23S rRNA pseudouridine1911/1915/1917 synthase
MAEKIAHTVPSALAGARLDKVLAGIMPGASLRLRRRLCEAGRVVVDGRGRGPAYKVGAGQTIMLLEPEEKREKESMSHENLNLSVIGREGDFAAVYKPGGVHSAAIEGKSGPSVEGALPVLFPDAAPELLNRLDFLTSGLLLVALTPAGARAYHAAEEAGEVKKFYLAEVRGRLDGLVSVRNRLDTDDRKTTRVLADEDPDVRRWTDVTALSHDHELETTRVRCLIMKGARHQIRAHLASLGHPIVGDPLYGGAAEAAPGGHGGMRLHHQRIELPGFSAEVEAPF